jgi:hypothetical protein
MSVLAAMAKGIAGQVILHGTIDFTITVFRIPLTVRAGYLT